MVTTPILSRRVFRIVTAGWLLGWFIKAGSLYPVYSSFLIYPITHHPLFPHLFLDGRLALLAYSMPIICLPLLWCRRRSAMLLSSLMMLLSSATLLVHINAFNDATYVTSLWVAMWLVWLAWNSDRNDERRLTAQAMLLAQGVIGLMFLGGVVGKLTPEYWNGDVLSHLYFEQKTSWPYGQLRSILDSSQKLFLGKIISRAAIVIELFLAAVILMPPRIGFPCAALVMISFVAGSYWMLYSVMGSLIALCAGCWYWTYAASGAP